MSFYVRMQKQGLKLLKKRGMPITLRRKQQGVYSPDTGTMGADTVTDYACQGYVANIDSAAANQFYSTSTLKESSIEKEDSMVVISAIKANGIILEIEPDQSKDFVIINGVEYDVIAIIPLAPAGIPVLYSMQVRR